MKKIKLNKIAKITLINFTIIFIGVLCVELIFGAWFKPSRKLDNLGILRNATLTYSIENLYEDSSSTAVYRRDENGLRGTSTFNNPKKIDILTVGGSTTDQRYITDSKTWQEVLEHNFKEKSSEFTVSNAGVDGQSTFGHLKNFEVWFPQIPQLKPKYILYYIGINDFYIFSASPDYDTFQTSKSRYTKFKNIVKNNSVVYGIARKVNGIVKANRIGVGHNKIKIDTAEFTPYPLSDSALYQLYSSKNLSNFKVRIQTLVKRTKEMGAIPIFVSQPAAFYHWKSDTIWGVKHALSIQNYQYNGVDYYHLLNKLNRVMEIEAEKENFPYIDLTSLKIWEPSDFYDWVHMTPKGAKKVGNAIFQGLKKSDTWSF